MANLIYEGQLMKKGKINKSWKNRWCIMSAINGDIYLQYYDSKINKKLMGTIQFNDVYDIKVVHSHEYDLTFLGQIPIHIHLTNEVNMEQKYSFILYTTKRKWIFSAFDPKNMQKWLEILDRYVYSGIIKRGFLQKRGEKNTAFKTRYFVLNKYKQLKYFQNEQCEKYLGTISINSINKITMMGHQDKSNTFHLVTDHRVWVLASDTAHQRKEWIDAINKCRKQNIHHRAYSLIDDVKETWDNFNMYNINGYDINEEDEEEENDKSHKNHNNDSDNKYNYNDKDYEEEEEEEEENEPERQSKTEKWMCASCQQIYATMWPKCPGCLRSNTHYVCGYMSE